ncbi:MAG TPA: DUF421 domain-containing protein [Flavipsychrobacter sp.]|nr:DUF421 domain-containing protein [Flavipsychrobacter sp.]
MDDYALLDFKRIFIGDRSLLFLVEIVFRTIIMYTYTIILLRLLGKRAMGQLSGLELAIIICLGSAVGDPMIGEEMPIIYGITAITTVVVIQYALEMLINRNNRLERIVEGQPVCLINNGIIDLQALKKENLSPADLFRKLRTKDVTQLGEVDSAFFETSGEVSVVFKAPGKIGAGLNIIPCNEAERYYFRTGEKAGTYCCSSCGYSRHFASDTWFPHCDLCGNFTWTKIKTPKRTRRASSAFNNMTPGNN